MARPVRIGVAVFATLFLAGVLIGFVVGLLASIRPCSPTSPTDPCGADATSAGFIWGISILISFAIALITAITVGTITHLRRR